MRTTKYVYTVEFESPDGGGLCGVYADELAAQVRLGQILGERGRYFRRKSKNVIKEWSESFGWGYDCYRVYRRKLGEPLGPI